MKESPGGDFGLEAAFRGLLQEVIRRELRPLEEQVRRLIELLSTATPRSGWTPNDVLTVGEVAKEMQVIPATVTGWIQSGALKAGRPGTGAEPGRHYRVLRSDLQAFVAASQSQVGPERSTSRPRSRESWPETFSEGHASEDSTYVVT